MKPDSTVVCRLADVAELRSGYQARTRVDLSASEGVRLIQGKDVDPALGINYAELSCIRPEFDPSKFAVRKNDVLFMSRGMMNYAVYIDEAYPDLIVSNAFYILRVRNKCISSEYLTWWLNQNEAQEHISQRRASGSTISYISIRDMEETPLSIPPKLVQDRIVALQNSLRIWKTKQMDLIILRELQAARLSCLAISKERL